MRDWSDLRVLAAVVRAGSLSAAARQLGVHHATIGRRITALEEELGVKLVDRLTRRTVTTAEGNEIAELAGRIEDLVDTIARRGRGGRSRVTGTVSISAPPIIASHIIAAALGPLLAAQPDLRIVLHASLSLASLVRGDADIAVRLSRPDQPSLIARRVATVDFALFGSPATAALSPENWRFIGYDDALAHVPHHRWFEEFVGDRPVVMRSSDAYVQSAAAVASVGVAMLPTRFATEISDLLRLDTPTPPSRDMWLVVHPDIRKSAAVRAVLDHLADVLMSLPLLKAAV